MNETNLATAFAKHEALYAAQVQEQTFGHLKAKPGSEYRGQFIFAQSLDGYTVLLKFDFPDELECSPWLHEDTEEFMAAIVDRELADPRSHDSVPGAVWRFEGVYRVSPRGRRRFVGKTRRIKPW